MTNSFSNDIRTYALAGAQARLSELNEEQNQIHRLFPELRNATADRRVTGRVGSDESSSTPSSRHSRRAMSAAQRKAVGKRMKKYWAARRGEAAATGSSDSPATGKRARVAKRGPRTMSTEARKRISDAQKARWAKQRGEAKGAQASSTAEPPTVAKESRVAKRQGAANRSRRKMSVAARKRMSQAQKKRWATVKRTTQ